MKTTDVEKPISGSWPGALPNLLTILLAKAWLIVLIAAVFALVGFVYASLLPAVYEARTTILIDESASSVPSYDAILANERRAQTYAYLLTSDALLSSAFNTLEKRTPTLEELETLRRGVEVQAVRGTQLIRISARDTSPLHATALVDALLGAFTTRFSEINTDRNRQTRNALQEQLVTVERQIARVSSEISTVSGTSRAQLEPVLVQLRQSQADLLQQMTKVQVDDARGPVGITQVEPAVASDKPVAPNKLLLALVAAFLGMLVGIGGSLFVELRQSGRQALQPLFASPSPTGTESNLGPRRPGSR